MDFSKVPTDGDFDGMVAEIIMLAQYLGQHHTEARRRAKAGAVKDGYPARSMPESEIHGGRMSDPTADYVIGLAGGDKDAPDHWKEPHDPTKTAVNNMGREVLDARNRLRGAASSLRAAMPTNIPAPALEQCDTCWVSKSVATRYGQNPRGWVAAVSRCSACQKRLERHGAAPKV